MSQAPRKLALTPDNHTSSVNAAADYLLMAGFSSTTRISMASHLNRAARFFRCEDYTHADWAKLRKEHVVALLQRLKKLEFAQTSIQAYLRVMCGVADVARRLGHIDAAVYLEIADIRPDRLPSVSGTTRQFQAKQKSTYQDLRELIESHHSQEPSPAATRDLALIAMVLLAGLNRQQLSALQLKELNLDDGYLKDGDDYHDLDDAVILALRYWLTLRGEQPGALFTGIHRLGHMTTQPIGAQAVYSIVRKRCRQAKHPSLFITGFGEGRRAIIWAATRQSSATYHYRDRITRECVNKAVKVNTVQVLTTASNYISQ